MAVKGFNPGDAFSYTRTFTQEDTDFFGNLTRDYNPVHYDTRWTEAKGFNGLICHGLLVGSMICEFGGQVGWLATSMDFKFIKPTYFGDTIQCRVTITKIDPNGRAEAEALFTNQNDEKICCAHMTGRLPMDSEKILLQKMIDAGDPDNRLSDEISQGDYHHYQR